MFLVVDFDTSSNHASQAAQATRLAGGAVDPATGRILSGDYHATATMMTGKRCQLLTLRQRAGAVDSPRMQNYGILMSRAGHEVS